MGLITGLLTLPLAPVRGVAWVAEQLAEQAEYELYDEGRIRRELLQLELDRDTGAIGEVEYLRLSDSLARRLAQGPGPGDAPDVSPPSLEVSDG